MRTKNEIKSRGTEVQSQNKWGTLLHIAVQEREKTWPAALTGLRRVHGHVVHTRTTAGGRPRGGASFCTPVDNFRPPEDAARAT